MLEKFIGNTDNIPEHPFPSNEERGSISVVLGFIVLIAVAAVGIFVWQLRANEVSDVELVACTKDARICPDGSVVGRIAPACEFASCPSSNVSGSIDDWQTYRNPRLHYEFEHPVELKKDIDETIQYPDQNQDLVQFVVDDISYGIRMRDAEGFTDIRDWIKDSNISHTSGDINDFVPLTVGGQPAFRMKTGLVTFVLYDQKSYTINAHKGSTAPYNDLNDEVYNRILSTVRFVDASEWKTYRNEQLGYTVSYPPHLNGSLPSERLYSAVGLRETVVGFSSPQNNNHGGGFGVGIFDQDIEDDGYIYVFSDIAPLDHESVKETVLGGRKAYLVTTGAMGCFGPDYRVPLENGMSLSLRFSDCPDTEVPISEYVSEIVSSFKFLE